MNTYQPSFTAGEISYDRMASRNDLARNYIGLKTLENMFSYLQGGVTTRPGMEYVGSTKGNKKSKLIPFVISNTESYMLEFGEYNLVIWTYWGEKVVNQSGQETIVNTPYPLDELEKIKYVQNGRSMIITSPNIEPQILKSYSEKSWVMENLAIEKGPFGEINTDKSIKFKINQPGATSPKTINFVANGEGIHTLGLPINIQSAYFIVQTPGGMPRKFNGATEMPDAPLYLDGSTENKPVFLNIGDYKFKIPGWDGYNYGGIKGEDSLSGGPIGYEATITSPSGKKDGKDTLYGYDYPVLPSLIGQPGVGLLGAGMGGIYPYYGGKFRNAVRMSTDPTHPNYYPYFLESLKKNEGKSMVVDFGSLDVKFRDDPEVLLGRVGGATISGSINYIMSTGSTGSETRIECTIPFFTEDHLGTPFSMNNRVPDVTATTPNYDNGTSTSVSLQVFCYEKWNFRSSGYWSGMVTIDQYDEVSQTWVSIKRLNSTKSGSSFNESGTVDEPCLIRVINETSILFAVPNGYAADRDSLGKLTLSSQVTTQRGIGIIVSLLGMAVGGKFKYAIIRVVEPFVYGVFSDEWAESAWSKEKGYPSQVAFYENRLLFASNYANPNLLWLSKTNDIKRFFPSRIIKDDDYFNHPLPLPRASVIQSVVSMGELIVFLDDGEWKFFSSDGPLTPKSASSKVQSYNGSSYVDPLTINNKILMLSQNSTRVQEYAYNNNADSFLATDISLYSEHMFRRTKIESWAFQKDPESIIWMVKEDGTLIGLTYLKEEEIFGYHRHITEGKILDVESLKSEDGNEVWFVVDRGTKDNPRYSIEKFKYHMEFEPTFHDSYALDCFSVCFSENPTSNFKAGSANLSLRKKTCVALVDGNYEDGIEVDEFGAFDLSVPAKRVIIGLPFEQVMETLPFDLSGGSGQSSMDKQNPKSIMIRFNNSFMPFAEFNGDNKAYQLKFGNRYYGKPNEPFSGLSEAKSLPNEPDCEKRLKVFMKKPFPMTITSISAKV